MKKYILSLILFMAMLPFGMAQQMISGTVIDNSREPLIGVNISVEGTEIGTISDFDGKFELKVPSDKNNLNFSYIGYTKLAVAIDNRLVLEVIMQEASELLEEIVVVGYGVQRKSDLTGSISNVKAKEIAKLPVNNVSQALQGKISGVQVTPLSGKPGEAAVIRIRGVGTLNNASPLYVVDGMFVDDINFLDPGDVESIEVLKDASAAAIYGSRGANGVILVTTKQAEEGSDAIFELGTSYGTQHVIKKIDMVNANEFAILANELAENESIGKPFEDPSIFGEGTNWQDEIFQVAPIANHKFSVLGSSGKVSYNFSVNHASQEGIVKGSKFERTSIRLNNNYKMRDWISLGHNLAFSYKQEEIAANVISSAYKADPTVTPIDSLGNFSNTSIRASVGNPTASSYYNDNKWWGYRSVGNFFVDIKPIKDLVIRSSMGIDLQYNQGKNFTPVFYVSPIQENKENILNLNTNRTFIWLWENTATYTKNWNDNRLTFLSGITAQKNAFEDFGGSRKNFPGESSELYYLGAGEIEGQTNSNSAWEYGILSYLFRTNYVYKDKYLLTLSMRADGSTKFGINNRWGYFPSVALGWNVTHEKFMEKITFLSRLKLRASWGILGNEQTGPYDALALVNSNLNSVFGSGEDLNFGASVISQSNPDLRWESTSQLDLGVELATLNDRLTLEFDFYNRLTDGILTSIPIPGYVGSSNNPVLNAAEVLNRGIDLSLGWRDHIEEWDYHATALISKVHNEVIGLGEGNEDIFGGDLGIGGILGTRTIIGAPIGSYYGYRKVGIFQSEEDITNSPNFGVEVPGDIQYEDTNNDGILDAKDRVNLGNAIPSLIYGFSAGLGYKAIEFSFDVTGQTGNKIINAKKMARFGTYNFETSYLDRWNSDNPGNSEPRITNGGHNYKMSDRFIEDGTYWRLRNVQLALNIPEKWSKAAFLKGARIYVSGTNIFTSTTYSGYTPEIVSSDVKAVGIDKGVYPVAKTYIVGLNIKF